jgi:hypothetical protein
MSVTVLAVACAIRHDRNGYCGLRRMAPKNRKSTCKSKPAGDGIGTLYRVRLGLRDGS